MHPAQREGDHALDLPLWPQCLLKQTDLVRQKDLCATNAKQALGFG